ncbi:hypothetical protein [uncultured Serinicoccus sp.]|uniref:hypothetical protein n=1 Tax=uncultured Serinicoccus sp. TaxID=735514 RepID=UPI002629EFB2|nr:hypothetical protein [uncultured Serinicoccus sp.]
MRTTTSRQAVLVTGYVYTGSVTEPYGQPVPTATIDRCTCQHCPEDPFTCPTCSSNGGHVEYLWNECPHHPPPPRYTAWTTHPGGHPVGLVTVRADSLTPAPHHNNSCSP